MEVPFSYAHTFAHEVTPDGGWRLCAGLVTDHVKTLGILAALLRPPYHLLYILHRTRTEAPLGRYTSRDLTKTAVTKFLVRFGAYLEQDARHDLWIHAPRSASTLVLDRFNLIYGYGELWPFARTLEALHLREVGPASRPRVPQPHALHYHPAWDDQERRILTALDWQRAPLQSEDIKASLDGRHEVPAPAGP